MAEQVPTRAGWTEKPSARRRWTDPRLVEFDVAAVTDTDIAAPDIDGIFGLS